MVVQYVGRSKSLTSIIVVIWMAAAIALIILSTTQNEDGDQKEDKCGDGSLRFTGSVICKDVFFVRPFRFGVDTNFGGKDCGPFICGWGGSNANFHIVNVSFTLLGGIVMLVHMWTEAGENKSVRLVCLFFSLALSACYFSSFSIDADNVRTGNTFCKDGWKVGTSDDDDPWLAFSYDDATAYNCHPSVFVFTLLAEVALSAVSGFIFLILFFSDWTEGKMNMIDYTVGSPTLIGGEAIVPVQTASVENPSIQKMQQDQAAAAQNAYA